MTMPKRKKFRHETCKLRVSLNGVDIGNALTEEDIEFIDSESMRMGVSKTHVITSLVKRSIMAMKEQEETNEVGNVISNE